MSDFEILKTTFRKIGVNFSHCETLFGFCIMVQTTENCIEYEFDSKGKFEKIN